MAFNRQLYKQKPQAYGPPSVVQASILKNAERMGIAPSKLSGVFPFWEGAGSVVRNAIDNGYFTPINHSWGNNSLDLTAANSKATYTGDILNKRILSSDPVTFFYRITNTNMAQTSAYVQQYGSDTLALLYGFVANTYETFGWGGRKTIGVMSADDVGKDVSLGVSWDGLTGNYDTIYNRTIASGTDTFNKGNSSTFVLFSVGTGNYFAGKLNFGIMSAEKWASNTLLLLDDNPYFLLQRVAPVFYSVPGGAVIPTFNPLFLNAAQPTRVIQ